MSVSKYKPRADYSPEDWLVYNRSGGAERPLNPEWVERRAGVLERAGLGDDDPAESNDVGAIIERNRRRAGR